ncbi:MAG: serine protease, partial [Phycisphaerales bacterium]
MKTNRNFLMSRFVFLVCPTIFSSSLAIAKEDLPAIVKKISPSVVVIQAYDKEGKPYSQGSGFFFNDKGYVITNGHVLERADRAEVKTSDGNIYAVKEVLGEDSKADIILLSVTIPGEVAHPVSISKSFPIVGEQVLVIGSPLGLEQTVSEGIVSAIRKIRTYGKVIQITAPISPGSSGSPVVDMQGDVIGIATFQTVKGQNLNFSIPIDRVTKLKPEKGKTLSEWQDSFILQIRTNLPHKIPDIYSEGVWVSSVPTKLDVFAFPAYFSGLTWKYFEIVKNGKDGSPY